MLFVCLFEGPGPKPRKVQSPIFGVQLKPKNKLPTPELQPGAGMGRGLEQLKKTD